jgi:hypothetical protein
MFGCAVLTTSLLRSNPISKRKGQRKHQQHGQKESERHHHRKRNLCPQFSPSISQKVQFHNKQYNNLGLTIREYHSSVPDGIDFRHLDNFEHKQVSPVSEQSEQMAVYLRQASLQEANLQGQLASSQTGQTPLANRD